MTLIKYLLAYKFSVDWKAMYQKIFVLIPLYRWILDIYL